MPRYSAVRNAWTPVAVADTTNFTDAGYQAIQGVASTQFKLVEVYVGGQAASSAVTQLVLARDSTVGGTLTAGNLALMDATGNSPASLPTAFSASTTKPQRSSTLQLLNLTLNAFGGIVRWVAAPGFEITCYGATASLGEISLSSFNAGSPGALGSHMIIETQ